MSNTGRRDALKRLGAVAAAVTTIPAVIPFASKARAAEAAYPNRPIKIIAPVQPGGGVDLVARTIADRLGARSASRSSSRTRAAAAASSARWPRRAPRPTATR